MTYIKEKFLELTKRTYPYGTEQDMFDLLSPELRKDEFGNLFIKIGESDIMFTSHLDTATSSLDEVVHVIEGNIIKTDGKTILGADDKAGVAIMSYMIENKIPGLYYFFLGEEVGCIGSKKVAGLHKVTKIDSIKKVVSFDRRDMDSIVTFQVSQRCCSDKFAEALYNQLNTIEPTFKYKNDPTGGTTDSLQFVSIYPECTNISVGYKAHHTFSESQDIDHLEKLAEACLKIDWASLPVERDPSKPEYKSYGGYGYGYNWDNDDEYRGYNYNSRYAGSYTQKTDKIYFNDDKYNYISCLELDRTTKNVVSVELCDDRINYERMLIEDLLRNLELDFIKCEWNGFKLKVYYSKSHHTECNRNDILVYLPEMDYYVTEKSIPKPNKAVAALPPHNIDDNRDEDYYNNYYYGD